MDLRPSAEFSGKMHRTLRSLAEYLATLAFLCCHYIFDSYDTYLTLSFNIVYVCFHSHQSQAAIISATFKSILRCSLEPNNYLRGALSPETLAEGLRAPSPQTPSSVATHYSCFSTDYVSFRGHFCLLSNLVPCWFF